MLSLEAEPVKIGLALGGGAARGLAHIGVLEVFEDIGLNIDYLSGTSIGAIIGAFIARGITISEIKEFVLNVDFKKLAYLLTPSFQEDGLVDGHHIREFLGEFLGDVEFQDLKLPFVCIATEFRTGQEIILNKGNLLTAMQASYAIPGVFPQVILDDYLLVDGGLVNPVPFNVLREMGANVIIGINVMPAVERIYHKRTHKKEHKSKQILKKINSTIINSRLNEFVQRKHKKIKQSIHKPLWLQNLNEYWENIFHKEDDEKIKIEIRNKFSRLSTYDSIINSFYTMSAELVRLHSLLDPPDLLIEPDIEEIDFLAFHKAEEAIEIGHQAALKVLPELEKIVTSTRQ